MAALQNRSLEHEYRRRRRRLIQPRRQGGFGVSQEAQIAGGAGSRDVELRQGQRNVQTGAREIQCGGSNTVHTAQ